MPERPISAKKSNSTPKKKVSSAKKPKELSEEEINKKLQEAIKRANEIDEQTLDVMLAKAIKGRF